MKTQITKERINAVPVQSETNMQTRSCLSLFRLALIALSLTIGIAGSGGIANAGILTGSVSFNSITNLYTYSYTLDNRSGPATVNDFAILISTVQDPTLTPAAHTDPGGSIFFTSFSGSSSLPPLNESGTFWEWASFSVPVGTMLSGFSFSTPYAPVSNSANNYFLYGDTYTGGPPGNEGVIEYGHIVAPDVPVPTAPEPSSLMLFGSGILGLAGILRRRLA